MTNTAGKTPWQDGYWTVDRWSSTLFEVRREKWDMKSLIALDYPDMEIGNSSCILKYGDFGEARKEISEATGSDKYNMEIIWWGAYKMRGVINDNGTAIHYWDEVSKTIGLLKWLTPENLEELKEDRDDINSPRYAVRLMCAQNLISCS